MRSMGSARVVAGFANALTRLTQPSFTPDLPSCRGFWAWPSNQACVGGVKTATAAGSGTIGRISIGILSSLGTGYLRDLIEVYRSRHPEVGIQMLESAAADNVAAVRKRQLDVAFIMD